MKLVFCGTPQFAAPSLEKLAASGFDLPLVVTQPDRPQGRGMESTAPPVKQAALKLGVPVLQPAKIKNNEEFRGALQEIRPDAIIVVGYGRIIPPWMIDLPVHGNINVHASLLPKYRGAAPIQWALARGETVTGITIMRIDQGLDTGDILLRQSTEIQPEDTTLTLAPRLAAMGADLLVEALRGLETGKINAVPQDHSQATMAPILTKEDGRVDFNRTAAEIHHRMRGFQPWPGAYTQFRGKNLKIISARPTPHTISAPPAELLISGSHLLAGCGQGTGLDLLEVQPEGKKPMSAQAFASGYHPSQGERLG